MWRNLRILILLLVLFGVALSSYLDERATHSWQQPLWVGIFPLNADGSAATQAYVEALTARDFADIGAFFAREAARYGVSLDEPVHVELYPQGHELPPALDPGANPLMIAWWSLKLRMFAARAAHVPGRAPPRVRLFVLYHDPATFERVPDSHGLQKGLVGVVHGFAARSLTGSNNIVIAHEFLHTAGASDKYDLATDQPLFPSGYADREQQPLYPQRQAEVMAVRRALSPAQSVMPPSLKDEVVGPETALEIRWRH